jgi:hypothetical protein
VIATLILIYMLAGTLTCFKSLSLIMDDDKTVNGWADVGTILGCVILILVAGAIWPAVTLIYYLRYAGD